MGAIATPKQRRPVPDGAPWCADNGKFGKGWPGFEPWIDWLDRFSLEHGRATCLFATCPDEVGDAAATLEMAPWLARIRQVELPAAFVAQDGCASPGMIPWGEFDVLFLGGTDEFKLGSEARYVSMKARERGVPVHMGRVNSYKRMAYARSIGCSTADGTFLKFSPANLLRIMVWYDKLGLDNFAGFDPLT